MIFNVMKKFFNFVIFLFLCLTLVSCTTLGSLSEEEKKVKVGFSKHLVKECRFIDGFFEFAGLGGDGDSYSGLKKKAFAMGGDRVLISRENTLTDVEVYRCSEKTALKTEQSIKTEEETASPSE